MSIRDFFPEPTLEEYMRLQRQLAELLERVGNGRLDLGATRRMVQCAIIGEYPVFDSRPERFASLASQLESVARWDKQYDWGFTEVDFAKAYVIARSLEWPRMSEHHALVLVPSLATVADTLLAMLKITEPYLRCNTAPWVYTNSLSVETLARPEWLQLADGITFQPNTLEWRLVNLEAHKGSTKASPTSTCGAGLAHAEVFAALAHFPNWRQEAASVEGFEVTLAGYRLHNLFPDHTPAREHTLSINRDKRGLRLDVDATAWYTNGATATSQPVTAGRIVD